MPKTAAYSLCWQEEQQTLSNLSDEKQDSAEFIGRESRVVPFA